MCRPDAHSHAKNGNCRITPIRAMAPRKLIRCSPAGQRFNSTVYRLHIGTAARIHRSPGLKLNVRSTESSPRTMTATAPARETRMPRPWRELMRSPRIAAAIATTMTGTSAMMSAPLRAVVDCRPR